MQSAELQRAVKTAGSVAALAKIAGVTPQAVSQWTVIPILRAKSISAALGIPLHDLRPDLWDAPTIRGDVGVTIMGALPTVTTGRAA